MRVGTMTSTFRERREGGEPYSNLEAVQRCYKAGFRVLDMNMCALPRRTMQLHQDDWRRQTEELRNEADKLGVSFVQSHLPYRGRLDYNIFDDEGKKFHDEMVLRGVEISSILGVKWAVAHPETDPEIGVFDTDANIRWNHQIYDRAVELGTKLGVGIAFENMGDAPQRRRFACNARELEYLMDSYKGSLVGLCWDVGHANRMFDDQVPAIMELGDKIKALHIDDNIGQTDLHTLPFLGNIKWEEVFHALYVSGCKADLIFEVTTNAKMPEALRDTTVRFMYEVGEYLVSLYK